MSRCDTCYWCDVCAEKCRGYRYAESEIEEHNEIGKEATDGE